MLQLANLLRHQPAIGLLPPKERRLADPHLAAHLLYPRAALRLLQSKGDLLSVNVMPRAPVTGARGVMPGKTAKPMLVSSSADTLKPISCSDNSMAFAA
jgi:hypothetical protein